MCQPPVPCTPLAGWDEVKSALKVNYMANNDKQLRLHHTTFLGVLTEVGCSLHILPTNRILAFFIVFMALVYSHNHKLLKLFRLRCLRCKHLQASRGQSHQSEQKKALRASVVECYGS